MHKARNLVFSKDMHLTYFFEEDNIDLAYFDAQSSQSCFQQRHALDLLF